MTTSLYMVESQDGTIPNCSAEVRCKYVRRARIGYETNTNLSMWGTKGLAVNVFNLYRRHRSWVSSSFRLRIDQDSMMRVRYGDMPAVRRGWMPTWP